MKDYGLSKYRQTGRIDDLNQEILYDTGKLYLDPPLAINENGRLNSLWSYGIFKTRENRTAFLKIVEVAKSVFQVPIALISLVERESQWFLAESGLGCDSTGRDVSFCGHAILNTHGDILEVLDATKDWRFKANPLVTGSPFIRFYAGMPLSIKLSRDDPAENYNIGTICLIDSKPHDSFSEGMRSKLKTFSNIIVSLMENWKLERTMLIENNLQMTILKGLQSTILSKTLQQSISIFLETIIEVLQVSALIITKKTEKGTQMYCGQGVTLWNESWETGYISFETINHSAKEILVKSDNSSLIPDKTFHTAASVVIMHRTIVFGVLIVLSREETKPITENYLKILRSISQTISCLIDKHEHIETMECINSKERKTKEDIRSVNERLYVTKKILSAVNDGIKNPLQGINDSISITNSCNNDCQNTNKIIANCTRALFSVVNNLIEAKHLLSPGYDKFLESNLVFNEITAKELLKIAVSSLKFQLKQTQIQLECKLKYANIQLRLDVEKATQVLFNVIGNSIKFSNPGNSTVFINDKLDIEGKTYELRIRDEGSGFSDDIIKRMGEGFLQDDGVCNGMGLGLHLSIKFMNVMKGKISFQKPKRGAEVLLGFPDFKIPESIEEYEICE